MSSSASPSTRAASAARSAQRRLCPPMYGDLRSMKSATTVRASSSSAPASMRWGSGSAASTASHGSISRSRSNQARSVRDEQVGERRVVRAVAAIASGVEGMLRREEAADRLHVVAEVHDAHRERDRLPLRMGRIAVAVPALEREAQRVANAGAEVEPLHEHVGDLAPGGEVVDRPLAGGLLDHADDLVALVRAVPGRREGHHVPHDLGGIRGVVHQRLGADGDLVAEHGGDLVGVAGAADVPEQRHPVGGLAHVSSSNPAASQIHVASRHDRSCDSSGCPNALSCASASVATNSPRRSGVSKMGSPPDVSARTGRARSSHDASPCRSGNRTLLEGGHHGGITPRR